jgi:hypothetical protein
MNHRRKVSLIAGGCLVFSLAASALILHRTDQIRPQATIEEVLFLSSPKVIEASQSGLRRPSRRYLLDSRRAVFWRAAS